MHEMPRGLLARIRERNHQVLEQSSETRTTLMKALAKAAGKCPTGRKNLKIKDGNENPYYTLTAEQMRALVSGNIEKVESWVSNLDKVQATWLFRWLAKQDW